MKRLILALVAIILIIGLIYILSENSENQSSNDGQDTATSTEEVNTDDSTATTTENGINSSNSDSSAELSIPQFCRELKSNVAGSENFYIVTKFGAGTDVSQNQKLSGCVYSISGTYGQWAPFEGQVGSYELRASDETILTTGPLTVENQDWMESATLGEPLRFNIDEISFDANSYNQGQLIIRNANASGLAEQEREVTIPVTF